MTYNMADIGKRIREERESLPNKNRKRRGISQGELAEKLGYAVDYRQKVANWESGAVLPSLEDLIKLCDIFDCEMGYLLCQPDYSLKTGRKTDIQAATGLCSEAIDALIRFTEYNDSFEDEDGNNIKLEEYLKPSNIVNALISSPEFDALIMDIMQSRSFMYLAATSKDRLNEIDNMSKVKQERFERKSAELGGWASSLGYALLSGNAARDLYIQKAADRIKTFENRMTDYCENKIRSDVECMEAAPCTEMPVITGQVDDFCWDDFFDASQES